MSLHNKDVPYAKLPLRADASIIYKNDLGAFAVRGRFLHSTKEEWVQCEKLFTNRDIYSSRDSYAVIEYVFDHLKEEFLRNFVGSQLDNHLNPKATS